MTNGIIYLLVSGGMESVFMLYKMMKESPYEIRAHHIKLDTPQGRSEAETLAFNNCINWLRSNIGEIEVSFSEYKQDFEIYIPDYTIITYTAYALSKQPNVIAVGQGQSPMYEAPDPKYYAFMERRTHMLELYKAATRERHPTVPQIFPILNMTRYEMLDEMPKELFELTWSCRTPVQITTNGWEACGECQVCVPFKELGIPLNEIRND